ncbi:hypothetical protein C8A05DRAFT_13946 [Staphylotrichum tortipilum]|uniref:Uncharacterized protein n=1 Tax=Staphylotrichum tortipilum TaxID=2831512 RepID=A0AAN6MQH7_9PEZI|nr:hypothetical protein C8A05DRAFT_13946 [Staphylotrichum longicolle]
MVAFPRSPAAAAGWLLLLMLAHPATAAIAPHPRFAAVETGAVLSPRQYHMSPAHPLRRRQDRCSAGSHPCDEIGPPGANLCCPDTQYCIIDPTDPSKAGCCHIGSRCNSPCLEAYFECPTVLTLTTGPSPTTSTSHQCCPRTCASTSMYQCASSLGGGCCSFGFRCGSSGHCLSTPAPTSSVDLSLAPPGCTTGQISCAPTDGGGCCAASQTCTLITGQAHCADNPITPTGSGVSVVSQEDQVSGLQGAGAKAGVAVGVVVGAGLIIGAATWWCLRRRRGTGRGESEGESSARPQPGGLTGRVLGGSTGVPGRGEMSDATSDVVSRNGRLAQDYFSSGPAVGPYSDTYSASGMTTPGVERGGVPLMPHDPADIAVPVEIDSRLREEERPAAPSASPPEGSLGDQEKEEVEERFELYGSEVGSPSVVSPYLGSPPDDRPGRL